MPRERWGGRTRSDGRARAELVNLPTPPATRDDRRSATGPPAGSSHFWRDIRYALRLLAHQAGLHRRRRNRPSRSGSAPIRPSSASYASLLLEPIPFPIPTGWSCSGRRRRRSRPRPSLSARRTTWTGVAASRLSSSTGIWEFLTFNLRATASRSACRGCGCLRRRSRCWAWRRLGRTFTADEDQPGHDVAIISEGLWQRRFGASPDIVGRTARVNGRPFQIVGVMPESFRFTQSEHQPLDSDCLQRRGCGRGAHSFYAAARLRDGVTFTEARAEMDALGRSLAKQYPNENGGKPPP